MDSHVTTEYGKQNIFAKEPQPYLDESYKGYLEEGESLNGRLAMLGFTATIGAYLITGQIIPGVF